MPVYLHLANLIISKKAVEQNYRGGTGQFCRDFYEENDSFQEDVELFALGRMNCDEFPERLLNQRGLHYDIDTGTSRDYVIVSRYGGPLWTVDWLNTTMCTLYTFHNDCSLPSIVKALQKDQMTVDEAQRIFKNGGNPFEVIW
jgi:hypothetical protein